MAVITDEAGPLQIMEAIDTDTAITSGMPCKPTTEGISTKRPVEPTGTAITRGSQCEPTTEGISAKPPVEHTDTGVTRGGDRRRATPASAESTNAMPGIYGMSAMEAT
jgi:hypothetical protein